MNITKAVFPVAGLGTRFLPATKANPKEMLPIVDKPLIQYAVEEAVQAGITELIFVTSNLKRAIEDHFDTHFELEHRLLSAQKDELLDSVKNIVPSGVSCIYVRQPQALGLGHAVLCAKPVIGDSPFAVLLADDLIAAQKSCLAQMVEQFKQHHQSIVAVENITPEQTRQYGVIDVERHWNKAQPIRGIVEKPAPSVAPSNWGVVGRYILTPKIFHLIESLAIGSGGEYQLTDAIATLLQSQRVFAHPFEGTRYDCGSKLGYLKATIAYGLAHPEVGGAFDEYLQTIKQTTEA